MSVRVARFFPLWMAFSDIIRIQIKPEDQHKTAFIFPWGTFAYRKMPFGLKNAGATFQRAMTLIFHDLKSIIEVFLDDLAAHSRMRMRHPYHLRLVFERCQNYLVRLNPHKCIFCVKLGRLLGFIIYKEHIRVNPLKVEEIHHLSPLKNIRHLQCLQGMENFLQRFVVNFANLTRGFMRLLKKDTPFYWDQ